MTLTVNNLPAYLASEHIESVHIKVVDQKPCVIVTMVSMTQNVFQCQDLDEAKILAHDIVQKREKESDSKHATTLTAISQIRDLISTRLPNPYVR